MTFHDDVLAGLAAHPRALPCKYFYDKAGSLLFDQICELPEYYLTRAERQILVRHADEIVGSVGAPLLLAELGSGSSMKTRLLIEACLRRQATLTYVPVDISRDMLDTSAQDRTVADGLQRAAVEADGELFKEIFSYRYAGVPVGNDWIAPMNGVTSEKVQVTFTVTGSPMALAPSGPRGKVGSGRVLGSVQSMPADSTSMRRSYSSWAAVFGFTVLQAFGFSAA